MDLYPKTLQPLQLHQSHIKPAISILSCDTYTKLYVPQWKSLFLYTRLIFFFLSLSLYFVKGKEISVLVQLSNILDRKWTKEALHATEDEEKQKRIAKGRNEKGEEMEEDMEEEMEEAENDEADEEEGKEKLVGTRGGGGWMAVKRKMSRRRLE